MVTETNTRIQLGPSDLSRSVAGTPDVQLSNRFYEQDPTNLEDQVALLSRPALRKWLTVGTGPIRVGGIYSQPGAFLGDLFVVSADTLYRIAALDESVTAIGTLGGETGAVSMAATDTTLFIADGSGLWYYTDNNYAVGTLTAAGAIVDNDVVRMGSMYYKFTSGAVDTGTPTGLVGTPWLVALGASNTEAIENLSEAIGDTGTSGTTYSSNLTGNTEVILSSFTTTTLVIEARLPGSDGNAIITTETGANISWGAGTLAAGGTVTFAVIVTPDNVGIVSVGVIASYCICVRLRIEIQSRSLLKI